MHRVFQKYSFMFIVLVVFFIHFAILNHFIYFLYAGLFSALKEAIRGVRSLCLNSGNNVSMI